MMDTRTALKEGTRLDFENHQKGQVCYTIHREIGRGGSCIVYDASYVNNTGKKRTVRVKECYPFKLNIIRDIDGKLLASDSDKAAFEQYKKRMKMAFMACNELFDTHSELTNTVINTLDIYNGNNTSYVISTYQQGKSLAEMKVRTLKEGIAIVKSIAKAIKKIHDRGYLYLDLKPDNIFVLDGVTELVQLFDFDSLVSIESGTADEMPDCRISYTKGFAALEQQMGKRKQLGKHTDVYGIGAILFYILFDMAPSALDCDFDASFDFTRSSYFDVRYRDKLYAMLTDFLHNTLANYYEDRYPDMTYVIARLDEIERYADTIIPYLISSRVNSVRNFVGREKELNQIRQWADQDDSKPLLITGIDGIGKTTLMQAYVSSNRDRYDEVLFLSYRVSFEYTMADDEQIFVNTIEQREEEPLRDYCVRKMKVIRELTAGKKVLFVLDDFDGAIDELELLLKTDWHVAVISQTDYSCNLFDALQVNEIQDRTALMTLFANCLQRQIKESEKEYIDRIIRCACGHTLLLELIAKLISNSYLSIEKAASLVEKNGVLGIAAEKVDCVINYSVVRDTVDQIMSDLFAIDELVMDKKLTIYGTSLFGAAGVAVNDFAGLLDNKTKDDLNDLIKLGWIKRVENRIFVHPVIRAIVEKWEWMQEYENLAIKILTGVLNVIRTEGNKENYPRKLQCWNIPSDDSSCQNRKLKYLWIGYGKGNCEAADLASGRMKESDIARATDHKKMKTWLGMSEAVLDACKNEPNICETDLYKDLLYCTIISMPRDREEYILNHASLLLCDESCRNDVAVMKLYELSVSALLEKNDLDQAMLEIRKAEKRMRNGFSYYAKGQFYDMLAGYYDARLNGAYYDDNEYKDIRNMLAALEKAIHYVKKDQTADSKIQLAKYTLSKAMVLIRCFPKKKKEIDRLLLETKKIIEVYTDSYSEIRYEYNMVYAWYFTLVSPDFDCMVSFIQEAYSIARETINTELNLIDDLLIPCANMMLEWKEYEEAAGWLYTAIHVCENYAGIIPYIRKKMDLYSYLLDVYFEEEAYEQCKEIITLIEKENEVNSDIGLVKEINPFILKIVYMDER